MTTFVIGDAADCRMRLKQAFFAMRWANTQRRMPCAPAGRTLREFVTEADANAFGDLDTPSGPTHRGGLTRVGGPEGSSVSGHDGRVRSATERPDAARHDLTPDGCREEMVLPTLGPVTPRKRVGVPTLVETCSACPLALAPSCFFQTRGVPASGNRSSSAWRAFRFNDEFKQIFCRVSAAGL
jgi:hypothetical protein